jgi:hypothetical protein
MFRNGNKRRVTFAFMSIQLIHSCRFEMNKVDADFTGPSLVGIPLDTSILQVVKKVRVLPRLCLVYS